VTIAADKITNTLEVNSAKSTVNSLVNLDATGVNLRGGGTLDLNGNNLTTTGTLNIGQGNFGSGNLLNARDVNAATLNVISGSSAQINGDGVISNSISIGGANDILQISQTTGDLTGLTFNGNSLSIGTGCSNGIVL
jgi:hypothetical protein